MKAEGSEKRVHRKKGSPGLTEEQLEALSKLAAMPDEAIDYSDIPPVTDFSGFEAGKLYRPVKETITVRLDSDVLHWLKQKGKGYQSRLNAILRKEMAAQSKGHNAA